MSTRAFVRVAIQVEAIEGEVPTAKEMAKDLVDALPKEWWDFDEDTVRDGSLNETPWGVISVLPLNEDGSLQGSKPPPWRLSMYQRQQRIIEDQKTLIGGLEASYSALMEERDKLKLKLFIKSQRGVEDSVMVRKIVNAMTEAGYEIAGWGNDDQLANLEGSLDDLTVARDEIRNTLDEVRTER